MYFEFTKSASSSNFRAQVYVNGYQFGRFGEDESMGFDHCD